MIDNAISRSRRAVLHVTAVLLVNLFCVYQAARADGPTSGQGTVYLADMEEVFVDCWKDSQNRNVFFKRASDWDGKPILVDGKKSPNGIWMHAPDRGRATARYALDGKYQVFQSQVGVTDNASPPPASPVTFKVFGDGRELWKSRAIAAKRQLDTCSVDIKGVKELELVVEVAGSHYFTGSAWLEPQVSTRTVSPTAIAPQAQSEELSVELHVAPQDIKTKIRGIEQARDSKLAELDGMLTQAQATLRESKPETPEYKDASARITTLAQEKMKVKSAASSEIESLEPGPNESHASASRNRRQPSRNQPEGQFRYERDLGKPGPATKYPQWNGPWKTCPVCMGTGHSETSRQETQRNISPDLSQLAGTGMSGRLTNAISYCELCGGTGSVPD